MATSLPSFCCSLTRPSYKPPKLQKCPKVRSQSFHDDEGKSENMVDANMSVLRERIRDVRKKERLELDMNCCRLENGWNYKASGYDNKHKISTTTHLLAILSEFKLLIGLVISALGFVFLSGSFCIFLVSFVVHLYK